MRKYTAFGLNIISELELPPLLSAAFTQSDIQIKYGSIDKQGLLAPERVRPFSQQAPGHLWLHIPDIGHFYVSNGNTIVVNPNKDADHQSITLFILGTCLGAIMHQRNRLVIHGNAIRFDESCVIFAGPSGSGKSTLAAGFQQQGYQILADDLAVIDEQLQVQPSYPQIKLWHDTTQQLNIDVAQLDRIRPQIEKYAHPVTLGFCSKSLPVKAVYILNNHNQDEFIFQSITGFEKFLPLKNNTYRPGYIDGFGLKAQHLTLVSQLANQVKLSIITRPNHSFELDKLMSMIEADIEQQEPAL